MTKIIRTFAAAQWWVTLPGETRIEDRPQTGNKRYFKSKTIENND
jgi:hypothetical protein